jgi:undecaprenyl diphosphate synthase
MNQLNHIAIIMDGNGRWGLKNKNSRNEGHKAGLWTIDKIINKTIEKKIKYLTLYVFSTENWKRPKKEINYLFRLLENFLNNRIKDLNNKNIKFFVIGKKNFSIKLNYLLNQAEKQTRTNNTLQLNLALNYGSKSEIINTIKFLNKTKRKITENNISNNLYTKNIPDPDILIRTGNRQRLSNFLLWQSAYTEIFLKKNYGQILMKKILVKLLRNLLILKETLDRFNCNGIF